MKFDAAYDVNIWVSVDRRNRTWLYERQNSGQKVRHRHVGHAPVGASGHTLLLIATINALAGATKATTKLRVRLGYSDATFGDALTALLHADRAALKTTPLRAGRNFMRDLARVAARYEIVPVIEDHDSLDKLRRWSRSLNRVDITPVAAFQVAFPSFAQGASDFTD